MNVFIEQIQLFEPIWWVKEIKETIKINKIETHKYTPYGKD